MRQNEIGITAEGAGPCMAATAKCSAKDAKALFQDFTNVVLAKKKNTNRTQKLYHTGGPRSFKT